MNKPICALAFAALFSTAACGDESGLRDNPSPATAYRATRPDFVEPDPLFAIVDMVVLRPLSLVATGAGVGLFAAISPFAALASIPAPHNAFVSSYNVLIRTPARYTFVRPVGDRSLVKYSAPYGDPNSNR